MEAEANASVAQNGGEYPPGPSSLPFSSHLRQAVELPPGDYQPTQSSAPPSVRVSEQPMPEYGAGHIYSKYQPNAAV